MDESMRGVSPMCVCPKRIAQGRSTAKPEASWQKSICEAGASFIVVARIEIVVSPQQKPDIRPKKSPNSHISPSGTALPERNTGSRNAVAMPVKAVTRPAH